MIPQVSYPLLLLLLFVLLSCDAEDQSYLATRPKRLIERPMFENLPPIGQVPRFLPLQHYGPIDRFWKAHSMSKSLVINGVDYYPKIEPHPCQSRENIEGLCQNTPFSTLREAPHVSGLQGSGERNRNGKG